MASTNTQRVQRGQRWRSPSSNANGHNPCVYLFQYTSAKVHPVRKEKKTMRRRSEMLINIKCKHQLLCLDRSWSQVRFFIFQPGPLGTPTQQSSLDMPGESNFNSSDNSHVHDKKESSNRWLTWTPVYPIWASLSLILAALPPTWRSESALLRPAPASRVHLAGSYDEVGHPGFADPKCLHELLFREGERKLDLCWE